MFNFKSSFWVLSKGFMMKKIEGLLAAPFSPLDGEGQVNTEVIPAYAKFLKKNGVKGVFVNGTSGEGYSLTTAERKQIAEAWIKEKEDEFLVIIQVGSTSIEDAKDMARHAQDQGADAFSTMSPIFFKPSTVQDLANHTAKIAQAAPKLPFYFYHIPQITGVDFSMKKYLELAVKMTPNLAGIKFSKPNLYEYKHTLQYAGDKFDILYCQDQTLLPALSLGAKGSIGSTYNFAPGISLRVMEAVKNNDVEKAAQYEFELMRLVELLVETGSYFTGAKALLKRSGVDLGIVRSPLRTLTEEQIKVFFGKLESEDYFSKIG